MALVASLGQGATHTSFDEAGEHGGYGLADRFDTLKQILRSDAHHLSLHGSSLRAAVLPERSRRHRRHT